MQASPQALAAIRNLRNEKKFVPTDYYPGAPDEDIRERCEAWVNRFIDEVSDLLAHDSPKGDIFFRARTLCDAFSEEDTEEREHVGDYLGEVMRAIEIHDWTDHV